MLYSIMVILNRLRVVVLSAAVFITTICSAKPAPILSTYENDYRAIMACQAGIIGILDHIEGKESVWGLSGKRELRMINQDDREDLVTTWMGLLDYFAQLDYIMQSNNGFIDLAAGEEVVKRDPFLTYYLTFLVQYRYALEFLDAVEKNKALHIILNEAAPGLEVGSYRRFKYHFLNVAIASRFVALSLIDLEFQRPPDVEIDGFIADTRRYLIGMGVGRGTQLTLMNAFKIIGDGAFALWYPIQKGTAELIADRKVWRRHRNLLSAEDISTIAEQLQPGDIIFQRREWYLTNVGIPGYWTHSALYIGTPEERRALMVDSAIVSWVLSKGIDSGDLEQLIAATAPDAYARSLFIPQDGSPYRLVESMKPGVIFATLEESFTCDGLAVIRPRLSAQEKAVAIFRAFEYVGRPYDFNFDFLTDSSLVCSELIYKAYEPTKDYTGLSFALSKLSGRLMSSPNQMVEQFAELCRTANQQSDFVLFYDGNQKIERAVPSSEAEFCRSWTRPDWYLFTQEGP